MIVFSLHRSRSSHRLDKISLEQNKLLDTAGNKTRKLVNTACRVMSSIADLTFSAAPQYALEDSGTIIAIVGIVVSITLRL